METISNLVLSTICSYLSLREISNLCQLNKKFRSTFQKINLFSIDRKIWIEETEKANFKEIFSKQLSNQKFMFCDYYTMIQWGK